jgi:Xaa-Pro aminopeptidase
MKYFVIILFVILLIAGCKKSLTFKEDIICFPDINDLTMTEYQNKIFSERRFRLLDKIENGIVILQSGFGYDGGRHESRVANNFYYLTGCTQPGSVLVLSTDRSYLYKLFIKEKSIRDEIYTGEVPEVNIMMNTFQADTVLYFQEFGEVIKENVRTGTPVYIELRDSRTKELLWNTVSEMKDTNEMIQDITPIINEMRVFKNEQEIARIQKAIDITGNAVIHACRICRPDMYEFEIEAMIEYTFLANGSSMPGFESIVASGPNAVTLHYSVNDRKMEDGDLLLMDIGAEYGYYTADITRTIPVNGKFTEEQKDIYELVLKAQKAAIGEMIPGNYIIDGHNKSNEILFQGLYDLGLITDIECPWQKKFYILYPISHYLGLYVHDVGDYGAPDSVIRQNMVKDTTFGRILEKGMVLTVEPGLYFRNNGLSQLFELFGNEATHEEIQNFIDKVTPVYEKYKNIGVRIEDDILITENGNIVLSKNIPKETDEIERIMHNPGKYTH